MSTPVYYGCARQHQLRWEETLPAKLDRILERLRICERVKDHTVAIKMHLGGFIGYSTIHPVFVRRVVDAVKAGGGTPFVTDTPGAVLSAATRGYTPETLGCPILPAAGLGETYYREVVDPYKNITTWKVAGQVADATFLIDFAHAKGHPSCGYGGVFKNLALGCQVGPVRGQIHDTCHYDQYWFPELCPDAETRAAIIAACPREAISLDRDNPDGLHVHFEPCNACGRCLRVAPAGSLKIDAVNFQSFQEACAHSTRATLSTFDKDKQVFLNLATHITVMCDCFGMTTMPIMPDVGIFGGDDICAVEQATLDCLAQYRLIEEHLPDNWEITRDVPHPLEQLHGRYKDPYVVIRAAEQLGLGASAYQLIDVMTDAPVPPGAARHISAAAM